MKKIIVNLGLAALFGASLLAGCATNNAPSLQAALDDPARMAADKALDAGRKPEGVFAFLGIKPGMTVMDVMASGGWYSEALSFAVGKNGKVYAQNPSVLLQLNNGAYNKQITERLAGDRLKNVVRLDKNFADLDIDNTVDVALTNLNFHDIYNRDPQAAVSMLQGVKKALKPGGVFGIIDHNGDADKDNAKLHRMTKAQAMDVATKAGFEVSSSDLLASKDDDHSQVVFAPALRGNTDRFFLKLTKPK